MVEPGGRKPVVREEGSIVPKNLFDILPGFRNRRKPLIALYGMFSGIVSGQSQRQISIKAVEQLPQILRPASDILIRIVRIPHL